MSLRISYTSKSADATVSPRSFPTRRSSDLGMRVQNSFHITGGIRANTGCFINQTADRIIAHHCLAILGKVPRITKADRKSTRLNSSHVAISYAAFCLKKNHNGIINEYVLYQ